MLGQSRQAKLAADSRPLGLTPIGRQKAEQWDEGGIKAQVLIILAESGPCTLSEIRNQLQSRGIRADYWKLRGLLQWMIRVGYVRPMGPEGDAVR